MGISIALYGLKLINKETSQLMLDILLRQQQSKNKFISRNSFGGFVSKI